MKKIGVMLGLMCLLLSGCNNKNAKNDATAEVNISQWMMDSSKAGIDIVGILGSADDEQLLNGDESYTTYTWDDYELIEGYKGTLQYCNDKNSPANVQLWLWRIPLKDDDFSKIHNDMVQKFGKPTNTSTDENNQITSYTFKSSSSKMGLAPMIFLKQEDDLITISWQCIPGDTIDEEET